MSDPASMADIIISGPITDQVARQTCARMRAAWEYYQYDEVRLHLVSGGGEVLATSRILREIERCGREGIAVRTIADGPVASAAAFLLSAGSPGLRECRPHARLLYHEPRIVARDGDEHTASGLHSIASLLHRTTEDMVELLVSRAQAASAQEPMPLSVAELPDRLRALVPGTEVQLQELYRTLLRLETWLAPEEARSLRVIDDCVIETPRHGPGGREQVPSPNHTDHSLPARRPE